MGNKAIKQQKNKKKKSQLNTVCCNSFHLMKGVEPQWNYGYSGSPMWVRSCNTVEPD